MAKVFCIDVSRCSGCYNCQFACKDEHCDNEWMPYAAKQPLTGQFWLKMHEHVMGSLPKIKMYYVPTLCRHCDNAACIAAGKDGAVYKREDGLVIIDPVKAKGQKDIVSACPYGAIYWNEELDIPQKCTGCAHLLAEGKQPRCVDVCETGALKFGEEEELAELIKTSGYSKPDNDPDSRVYYKGIPGEFIGGTIYDPEKEEVIRDALCVLDGEGLHLETYTDTFGDFWFKELPVGTFQLKITAKGYKEQIFNDIHSKGSVCLGDIPFVRE